MEEPIVYKKVENEEGQYIGKDGKRYDILTCHHTESREQVQVGTTTETDEEGNEIEVPVYESRVAINKGWDIFNSLEEAMEAYGLTDTQSDEPVKEETEKEQEQPEEEQEEVVISNEENTTKEEGEVEE